MILIHDNQASYSKDAIMTTNYTDDYIVQGRAFQMIRRFSHTSGQTIKHVLDFTGVSNGKGIFLLPISFTSDGKFDINTYLAASYTGGTTIPFAKLNINSSNTAQSVFKTGVTSDSTPGDDKREYLVGSGSTPASRAGGNTGNAFSYILNNQSKLIIETVNNSGATAVINMVLTFFEIPFGE